jgi:hypothetical protein
MRLLDRLFEMSPIDNRLIAAVLDRLVEKDLATGMLVIEVLLDEASKRLPDGERGKLLREFTDLANT